MKFSPDVCRFAAEAMNTTFEILIAGNDPTYASQAAQAAFEKIHHLELLFNRFDPGSEISQINRMDPGQKLIIGVESAECLTLASRIRKDTAGAFDIDIGSLLKYGQNREKKQKMRLKNHFESLFDIALTEQGYEISIHESAPGTLSLDLGGIGKGYALDKILEVFSDWDIHNVLVHGGTSTALALGHPGSDFQGWPVGVGGLWKCAHAPSAVVLTDRALSGSGTEVKGGHVLDPKTGLQAEGHKAAWASHSSAAEADALSTAFMVMSTDEVAHYCRSHTTVWALAVSREKKCFLFNSQIMKHAEYKTKEPI